MLMENYMNQQFYLLFVHGWGFSIDFWKPLTDLLQDFPIQYIDLGFVSNQPTPYNVLQTILDQQHTSIAIGHSVGLFYLLKQFPHTFHHYVAINSFLRFSKADDFVSGIPTRVLQRMSKGIDKDARLVLSQFYQQCQFPYMQQNQINPVALQAGLEWLEKDDLRHVLPLITQNLTVLASDQDPVVSFEMVSASFQEHPIYWVKDNTHILPITQPDLCATIIRNIALKQ